MEIKDINSFTDVEFVEGIIGILDEGWAIGSMCTPSGNKCLVGAGATLLGFDYRQFYRSLTATEEHRLTQIEIDVERKVSIRLTEILDLSVIHDPITAVTRHNDRHDNYVGPYGLRNELVAVVTRLKEEHAT